MFDDTALDNPTALASIDPVLRDVASWGAEVRRSMDEAAEALSRLSARIDRGP